MTSREDTRIRILEAGLEMAGLVGLECVTIGELAKTTGMSKSGLFAHFRSKEALQVAILDHAAVRFASSVVTPALKVPGGIPRIQALFDNWVRWTGDNLGGCVFVYTSSEYSERPGNVRERLLELQRDWIDSLCRMAGSAIKAGDFRDDADCNQFAYELYSLMLGFHLYDRLLNAPDTLQRQRKALERLLEAYR